MKYRELWKVYQDVFDLSTIRAIDKLVNSGYLRDILSPISIGKEASVFLGIDKTGEYVAVKIYKVMVKDYKRIHEKLIEDPRFHGVLKSRVAIVLEWVKKEFRNLSKMYNNNVRVPMPIAFYRNVLVMEFIGEKGVPAPLLKDKGPDNPKIFWEKLWKNIEKMVRKAELVHGDLSEFNILNFKEKPVIIDVSQALPIYAPNALEYLKKDLENITRFFNKLGLKLNASELYLKLINEV